MRQYSRIAALLFGIFLALFLLVEAFDITLLKEPSFWLEHAGVLAGFAGVCLLVADVALPVPSSLVMIAHGALFGEVIGTLLSLVGSTGAALAGFATGRRSGPLLARLVPVEELVQADCLLIRRGMLAIIVTRPVPLLAETTAIVVVTSRLEWGRARLAALAGSFPGALLYALTGAGAALPEWCAGVWAGSAGGELLLARRTLAGVPSRQAGKRTHINSGELYPCTLSAQRYIHRT